MSTVTIFASNLLLPPRLHLKPLLHQKQIGTLDRKLGHGNKLFQAIPQSAESKMTEEVKLLGTWISPFSRRVEMALKLKEVQYEYIEEDLFNKSALLLQYNPVHKKIPVLVHNGKAIAESLIILEYIDETWTNSPLLPKDSYDRAMARFWAKFVDEKIMLSAWRANTCKEEEREGAIEEASQQLKLIENRLKGKEFFGGETIGYLDIVVFVVGHWFSVMQEVMEVDLITEEKFPSLCKWIKSLLEVDVFKTSIPPREKHIAHIGARRQAAKDASK